MGCFGGGKSSSRDGSDTKFKLLSVRWEIAPDPIGEGGFGSVHLATNRKTGKVRTSAAAALLPRANCFHLKRQLSLRLSLRLHLRLRFLLWPEPVPVTWPAP